MDALSEFAQTIVSLPEGHLLILVALASIGLAAFAIYAVHSLAKQKDKQ